MVDLPICYSEYDVSMCFSEHGGTPLMSWRSWPEPESRVLDVRNLALAAVELMSSGHGRRRPLSLGRINHLAWKPEAGGRDPDPGEETQTRGKGPRLGGRDPGPRGRNPEAGSWNLEAESLRNLFMKYFSPTVCPLFSGFMFEGRK
ncbi:hypothetical protein F2Q69_00005498 [Brassica cretica]|uniref:Uncharacterized protein n=1 Tax=Brassica cretica TaxID=69181 RepID=A0A8S9PE58_BRACR|nr:hypothetical protein F2Q69_00005498 [Brassica cretica]